MGHQRLRLRSCWQVQRPIGCSSIWLLAELSEQQRNIAIRVLVKVLSRCSFAICDIQGGIFIAEALELARGMEIRLPTDLRFLLMSASESSQETVCVVKLRELGYSAAAFDQVSRPDNRRQSWGRFQEGKSQISGENPGSGVDMDYVRSRSSRRLFTLPDETSGGSSTYFTKYVELSSGCEIRVTDEEWLDTCCRVGPFDLTTDGQRRLLITPEIALSPPVFFAKSYRTIRVMAPCREFIWWTVFSGGSVMLVEDYALYEPLHVDLVNKYRRFRPTFIVAGPEFWTQLLAEIIRETQDTVDNGLRYELTAIQRRREKTNPRLYSSSHSDSSLERLAEDSDRSSPTFSVMIPGNRPSDFGEEYGKEDPTLPGDTDTLALIPFARLRQLRRAYVRVPVGKLSLVLAIEKIREILGGLVCLGILIEEAKVEDAKDSNASAIDDLKRLFWKADKCSLSANDLALLERVCQPIPDAVSGANSRGKSFSRGNTLSPGDVLGFHTAAFVGWSRERSVVDDALLSIENTAGHHYKIINQFSDFSRRSQQSAAHWICSSSSLPARSWADWILGGPRPLPNVDAALYDLGAGYTSGAASLATSAAPSVQSRSRKNTPLSIGSGFNTIPALKEDASGFHRVVRLDARALLRRLIRDAQEIIPGIRREDLAPMYSARPLSDDSIFGVDGTATDADLEALPAEERILLRLEKVAAYKSRRSLSSSAIAAIGKALVLANPNLKSYNSAVPPPPPPRPAAASVAQERQEYSRSQSVPQTFRRRSRTLINQEVGEQWLVEFTFARCEVLESWSPFSSSRWLNLIETTARIVKATAIRIVTDAAVFMRDKTKRLASAPPSVDNGNQTAPRATSSRPPRRPPPPDPRSTPEIVRSAMRAEFPPESPESQVRASRVTLLHKAEAAVLDEELNALRSAMAALRSGMEAWAKRSAEKVAQLHSSSDLSDEVKYAERGVRHAVRRLLSTVLNEWSLGLSRGGHETTADMLDDFVDSLTQSRVTSIDMLGVTDSGRKRRSTSFHEEEGEAFQELCRHFPGLADAAATFPEGENPFRLAGVQGGPEMAELLLAVLLVVLALENVRFARHKASLAEKFAQAPSLSETLAWLTLLRTQRRFADAGDVLDVEVRSLALCEAPPLTWLLQPETEEHASASLGDQSLIFTLDSILGAVLSKLSDPTSTIDWSLVGDINQATLARRSPHWELVRVLQQLRFRLGASLGVDLDFSKPKRNMFNWKKLEHHKFRSMPLYVPGARDPNGPELINPVQRSGSRRRGLWTAILCLGVLVGVSMVWYRAQAKGEDTRRGLSTRRTTIWPNTFANDLWKQLARK